MEPEQVVFRVASVIPHGNKCERCPFLHHKINNSVYCWLMDEQFEGVEKRCGLNVKRIHVGMDS